ncbi:MAG: hypothetical protein U0797_11880 [Gemmataceae bacterium]
MPYPAPRVQAVPLPDDQLSFQAAGPKRLRWHFASRYPGRSLRYGLHPHAKDVDPKAADERFGAFAASKPWEVVAAKRPLRVSLRRKT